mgnify:CR=1 FL=1
MKKRVHNFSAGPATLPVEILEAVESEIYDYDGIGSSIIEISHRDKVFKEVANKAEIAVRKLLSIWYYTKEPTKDLSKEPHRTLWVK